MVVTKAGACRPELVTNRASMLGRLAWHFLAFRGDPRCVRKSSPTFGGVGLEL